ncbi:hypothetical protein PAXRUDRAFT_781116 [Paxillus rubicundulus Ve08.2h10]|uniref:Uncharacterized protein n=1 Tax=Paxillus rubicundulus Ve08.2h10 TaxID=930991 RepID=A0A0D0DFP0_9AGAM|nr:hypothetical protein PAXRUDRAFT_781116 [Paxillus rubicundulus Ve08.2h10]
MTPRKHKQSKAVDSKASLPPKKLPANLNAIPEIDEPHNPLVHANTFFDAVTTGLPCDSDGYVSEKSETFDLDAVSSNGDDVDGSKVFTFQCIARQPNGSNAPFEIPSTISLEELCSKVGRKMERFPDSIRLQYRLESDRAWQGATSVQNDKELDLFKAKMRAMIGASRREELIKQLQERWKCDIHVKGPESPTYCYVPDEKSECFVREALLSSPPRKRWECPLRDQACQDLRLQDIQVDMDMDMDPDMVHLPFFHGGEWFLQHTERSQDGVNYSQFEGILQEKGFTRLSQFTSKHVTASDLQQWLGVRIGTAVNMKDYADDDLEAVRAGNLVIV